MSTFFFLFNSKWWGLHNGEIHNDRPGELRPQLLHCQGCTQVSYRHGRRVSACVSLVCAREKKAEELCRSREFPERWAESLCRWTFTSVETNVWNRAFIFSDMFSPIPSLQFQSSSSGECALMLFQWIFPNSFFRHDNVLSTHWSEFWMFCYSLNSGGSSRASAGTKQWSCSCFPVTRLEPSWSESQRQAKVRAFFFLC